MSDELIKRLRMSTTILPPAHICNAAADEIERLLEEVEHWRRIAETEHAMWANNLAVGDGND